MLTQLCIRDYAIVDTLDIEFQGGLTAVTGETGAGKSIILGALALTLGDRGDKDMVRAGAGRADISASFDLDRLQRARKWIQSQELDGGDEGLCVLRRTVGTDGRSKAWINGTPATLQMLRALGEILIDIHSQHEHQSLLDRQSHQRLLDDAGGHQALAADVRRLARQWRTVQQQLADLDAAADQQSAHYELIRYQVTELDDLDLKTGEIQSLETEYQTLSNADDTLAGAQQLLDLCSENDDMNILAAIGHAQSVLHKLKAPSDFFNPVADLLDNAHIQIEEAVNELRRRIDGFERDPERLDYVNQRMADIQQMARKHKVAPESLTDHHETLRQKLSGAEHNDARREDLRHQLDELAKQYTNQAKLLTEARRKAAGKLAAQINEQLKELGMPDARLEIQLTPAKNDTLTSGGAESAEFLISTNPGQPPRQLARIASGGELSRISLAIQVITALTSETPTLVFDEVDVGVGGAVARSVGRLLRQLGQRSQVLCVTHQPQVASQAHNHMYVSKQGEDGAISGTRIRTLDASEKIEEVARMLGGDADQTGFSKESLAHAREMMAAS